MSSTLKVDILQDSGGNSILSSDGSGAITPSFNNAGGLVLLHTTNVTSDVSEVDIDGFFSSTYRNYRLLISNLKIDTDAQVIRLRVNVGGSAFTTTGAYPTIGRYSRMTSANAKTNSNQMGNYSTYDHTFLTWTNTLPNSGDRQGLHSELLLTNPLDTSNYKAIYRTTNYIGKDGSNTYNLQETANTFINTTSALSGIKFYPGSGNISAGNFKLYGVV